MASSALQYAVGLAVGTAIATPYLRAAWKKGAGVARAARLWCCAAHAAGVWAIVPNIVTHYLHDPPWMHGWWTNLFVGHAVVERLAPHSTLAGYGILTGLLALQYTALLAILYALLRKKKKTL